MKVRLPRQASGQEIVAAFKTASTFHETPLKRWSPNEFVDKFQYEPGSVRQSVRSMGVRVWPSSLRKKWGLFGKKIWKPDFNPQFILEPVILTDRYNEVEIAVDYVYDYDQGGNEHVATDPHSPQFEHIRPQFEKILASLFTSLQLQQT